MQLRTHIHLSMLDGSRRLVRKAIETGDVDFTFGAQAVIYIGRLARLVREGRHDSMEAVHAASRLARAVALTPALPEDRSVPR